MEELSHRYIFDFNGKKLLTEAMIDFSFYKDLIDNCFSEERFNIPEHIDNIATAIKKICFIDKNINFQLFNYYILKTSFSEIKFNSYTNNEIFTKINIGIIYHYAIIDNKNKFIEIITKNYFNFEEDDISTYLKYLAGQNFIYKKNNDKYKLYCYNGNYWENNVILLNEFISEDLYTFLKMLIFEGFENDENILSLKKNLKKLRNTSIKNNIIESYKILGNNKEVDFDDRWWLFAFDNIVFDLKLKSFKNDTYDDYTSKTTGYNWRDPTYEEINTVNNLIIQIIPMEEERNLFFKILSTALEGKSFKHFIIFQGNGSNGKSLITKLILKALGDYGFIGDNITLFKKNKKGCNPENLTYCDKRYIVFDEIDKNKIHNSTIKALTNKETFSSQFNPNSNKIFNLTITGLCNKKPLFIDTKSDEDIQEKNYIKFRSKFVLENKFVDEKNFVFLANPEYKRKNS